jgi:hypothetical protein
MSNASTLDSEILVRFSPTRRSILGGLAATLFTALPRAFAGVAIPTLRPNRSQIEHLLPPNGIAPLEFATRS